MFNPYTIFRHFIVLKHMLHNKVSDNCSYYMILHIVPPKKTGKMHNMLNQFHHT